MPLYTFTCTDCSIELEELRSISQADTPLACPVCEGDCQRGFSIPRLGSTTKSDGDPRPVKRHPLACRCC
ncbi:MAG: zinc ribbon domain-containing protein [Anaerolineales bacterium]|nr:zinc ribbon domain-containing protein [Anaerolineales bacterium]